MKGVKTGKKIVKALLIVVVLAPAIIFVLNYFLAHRLEKYLKKELVSRVLEATDHFYTLTFDGLSIDLFSGELKIEGIVFRPDSVTFAAWQSRDSLPQTYLDVKVGSIDFNGVNLIWRWSYKRLNFNTFEVKSPELAIYNAYHTSRFEPKRKVKNTKTTSLYELIEPYINELTVGTLNLENALVSYSVENPATPIVYKLENVSFHAYGFRLDERSSRSGKLLYVENFDFITNQSQTLLANNEFSLLTDSIRLNTQDSIIYFENIRFVPQEKIWTKLKKKPSNYVDGHIEKIQVDGIAFTRKEGLNHLNARVFGVYSPDIKVYNLAPHKKKKEKEPVVHSDSLIQALSLYELISPVLRSVSIDRVSLEKTKADYYFANNGIIDAYHLKEFNFSAYAFLVDSLSDAERIFWYSKNFAFDVHGLEGTLKARNHQVSVGHVQMDTEQRRFSIENVYLCPISTQTGNDYLEGCVKRIHIEGLAYDNGIDADLFEIELPDIRYVRSVASEKRDAERPAENKTHLSDVQQLLNPFLNYLSIRNVRIKDASAVFSDRQETDSTVYRINHFNFYATDFLINERTLNRKGDLFFDYVQFGFDFRDFDNYLLNGDYRLMVDRTAYSSVTGLRLENVELIPLKKQGLQMSLRAPLVELVSPAWILNVGEPGFKMKSVTLDRFRMMNADVGIHSNTIVLNPRIDLELKGLSYDMEKRDLDVRDVYFHTEKLDWTFTNGYYQLHIGDILFDNNMLKLEDLRIGSPYDKIDFTRRHPKHPALLDLRVGTFMVNDLRLPSLVKDGIIDAKNALLKDVDFVVFKNKQVEAPLTYKPMINTYFQKAPVKVDIDSMMIENMDFTFELLPRKGTETGKLIFADINGVLYEVSNLVKKPDQYITLKANARFMNDGYFTTLWKLPADSLNDRFFLDAHMQRYDLTTLNKMIEPAAPIRIESGTVNDLTFSISGTDRLADIDMRMLYDDLIVDLMKEKNGKMVTRGLPSALINAVVRNSNPRRPNRKPHITKITSIERDTNRSTFNFIWKILQPAMADAVGVSYGVQEATAETLEFIQTVKSLFHHNSSTDVKPSNLHD